MAQLQPTQANIPINKQVPNACQPTHVILDTHHHLL